jgi:hypothetical protein
MNSVSGLSGRTRNIVLLFCVSRGDWKLSAKVSACEIGITFNALSDSDIYDPSG